MEKKGIFARQLVIGLLVLALCAGSVFAAQDYLIPGGYTVGIELEMRGVLVVDVEDGTCAAEAGVQKGDTIIRINARRQRARRCCGMRRARNRSC